MDSVNKAATRTLDGWAPCLEQPQREGIRRPLSLLFKRHVYEVGLRPIRLHDLRHTHATLALQAGVSAKVMQERLGHSSVAVTLDIYSHAIPEVHQSAADTIANLVFGG
jgi:integrase